MYLKSNKLNITFNNIVDIVTSLTLIEKEEVKDILERNIVEEKKEVFFKNYLKSKEEYRKGKLKFSGDIEELKKRLE